MASVLSIDREWSLDRADENENGSIVVLGYNALLDGYAANFAQLIWAHTDLPASGSVLPDDPNLTVRRRPIRRKGDALTLYVIEVTYETSGGSGGEPNPLSAPPQRRWYDAVTLEPIDLDVDGIPILNTALEPFEHGVTEEFSDLVYDVQWNTASWNEQLAAQVQGRINNDSFRGFAPGRCKLARYVAEEINTPGFVYYRRQAIVHVREPLIVNPGDQPSDYKSWFRRVPSMGFREWNESNIVTGKPIYQDIHDKYGAPLARPAPLDENGQSAEVPHFLAFKTKGFVNFSFLGIP